MDGLETVIEEPIEELEVEQPEVETEESAEPAETEEQPEGASNPYTTQFSREMRAAIKALEQQHPEQAKYLKHLRDQHARQFALNQIEPKGIDGVREKYALLQGLSRGDAKGVDALTAIQEELAGVQEVDEYLASGDPRAFEALGEDFNAGLAKLAPVYLERIQKTDPQAFEAAIAPHVVAKMESLPAMAEYNRGIDELNWILGGKTLQQLSPEELSRFATRATDIIAKLSGGLNEFAKQAGQAKPTQTQTADPNLDRQSKLDRQEQDFHWKTQIQPVATQHENQTFENLFKPYQGRLKLDAAAKADLLQAFKSGMNRAGNADAEYLRQMKIYRGQKNPDPTAVSNFVKNAINKHSKNVMEALVKARYGAFLAGKPKTAVVAKPGAKTGPVAPNVEIRTVKPPMEEIDNRNTPIEWSTPKPDGSRMYRLYTGKVIKVVRPQ